MAAATRPAANGSDQATAIADGRSLTRSTATTSRSCTLDRATRSISAFGIIVPNPRVPAMATVYTHESGRNTAITRM